MKIATTRFETMPLRIFRHEDVLEPYADDEELVARYWEQIYQRRPHARDNVRELRLCSLTIFIRFGERVAGSPTVDPGPADSSWFHSNWLERFMRGNFPVAPSYFSITQSASSGSLVPRVAAVPVDGRWVFMKDIMVQVRRMCEGRQFECLCPRAATLHRWGNRHGEN